VATVITWFPFSPLFGEKVNHFALQLAFQLLSALNFISLLWFTTGYISVVPLKLLSHVIPDEDVPSSEHPAITRLITAKPKLKSIFFLFIIEIKVLSINN
jgi:hypothetical protein